MVAPSINKFGRFSHLLITLILPAVIGSILVEGLLPVTLLSLQHPVCTKISLQKGWIDNDDENGKGDDGLVSREDLNRELLGMEPIVKRKRKNAKHGGGYRPLDNRDHLPFSVRTETPDDPYKSKFLKERQKQEQNKINSKINSGAANKKKRTDLDYHMLASTKRSSVANKNKRNDRNNDSTTTSRLIQLRSNKNIDSNKNDDDLTTVIGEFQLDKSTTSGDIIVLGEKEYQVQKARCQYKYAGGQRFVMVRKILEVKEVTRVQNEEALTRQYKSSNHSSSSTLPGGIFES